MPDEEKNEIAQKQKDAWERKSPEEMQAYAEKQRQYYANLSGEEKSNITKKILSNTPGKNQFNIRFENTFNESHLIQEFYYKKEIPVYTNDLSHLWDYGIYEKSTNKLVMVVDLDGAYFHADNCDYDGLHSNEEYDERRSLSIPSDSNIKICIIQEFKFKQCFENMIKLLIEDYDEYVDHMFKQFRSIPFPFPKYNNKELIKSYSALIRMNCDDKYHQDISLNTRVGDRVIMNFHESIWYAHTRGNKSPYDAWYDDKLLKKAIENRIIYQTYLNPNKILQGFNIAKIAQKVSVFSAGRAKLIINKYLNEYDTIFDPFSGFSGRMLGTISLGKQYIGQDISKIHINESNQIIEFLNEYIGNIKAEVINADILQSYGEYPCLFTCPPYSDKEQWEDVPVDMRTCDDWIDICLNHFKCHRYVFVVDNTDRYKDYIVDVIKNKSHFNNNCEYIVVINK